MFHENLSISKERARTITVHARETNPRLVWSTPEKFPTANRRSLLLGPLSDPLLAKRSAITTPSRQSHLSAISILATSDAITTSPMDLPAIVDVVLGKAKYEAGRPSSTVIGPRLGLAASLRKLTDRVSGATSQSTVEDHHSAPGTLKYLCEDRAVDRFVFVDTLVPGIAVRCIRSIRSKVEIFIRKLFHLKEWVNIYEKTLILFNITQDDDFNIVYTIISVIVKQDSSLEYDA